MRHLVVISLLFLSTAMAQSDGLLKKESTADRDRRMGWWREARFGLFIHWGLYSAAAGEWQGKTIRGTGEWIMHNAPIAPRDYETLAPTFNPTKFDADAWVRLAKDAGMKYIVITSKHHDGFSIYDSKVSDWDIIDRTPFKRDPLRELAAACKNHGIVLCFYHSIWDWHHECAKAPHFAKYVEVMKAQLKELLTNYGKIGVLWFDGEWDPEWTEAMGKDLYAYCRSIQPDLIINNRVGKGRNDMQGMNKYEDAAGDFCTPEQEIPARGLPGVDWESCMTMNDTWGFRKDDHRWKSSTEIIRMLCDSVSKGGNFLLNVGPTAEGEIPAESVARLRDAASWMATNKAAIYGTKAGPFRKLAFGRSATQPGRLLLYVFDWPADGKLLLPGLKSNIKSARLLADPARIVVATRSGDDLLLNVGTTCPDKHVACVTIDLDGPLEVTAPAQAPGADGKIELLAKDADLLGHVLKLEGAANAENVGFWTRPEDAVEWRLTVAATGVFDVAAEIACDPSSVGNTATFRIAEQDLSVRVPSTGGWKNFELRPIGKVRLDAQKAHVLSVSGSSGQRGALMNLRRVVLTPVK